jgi:rsbT co-antagonist protein RsbR
MMSQPFVELLGQNKEAIIQDLAQTVKEKAGPTYAAIPLDRLVPRMEAVYEALYGALAQDDNTIMEEFVSASVRDRVGERYALEEVQALISIMREIVLRLADEHFVDDAEAYRANIRKFEDLTNHARLWTFRIYLDAYEELMERQQRILAELSTPVIQVYENVLAIPLVGAIDTERARRIMEELLMGITHHQAELVIIDITGVPVVDTSVANHLIQTIKAARLLGAESILVGIGSEVAQTMVHLQIDLTGVVTRSNLQAGIEYALERMGLEIAPMDEDLSTEEQETTSGEA